MQGFRIHKWGEDPRWEEFSLPEVEPGNALVEVEACGVGLTVLNYSAGTHVNDPNLLPRVPGHEISGRVVAVGEGVSNDRLGERVVSYFYLFCGSCAACRAGSEPLCADLAGWVGIHRDGGYAEFVALPARNLIPIPDSLDETAATVVPDAVATSLHVCRTRARVSPGDLVMVIGAGGGVGMHLVQMATLFGAKVVGIERNEAKSEALENLGVVAVGAQEIMEDPSNLGPVPDVVVDLVGSSTTLRWSVDALGMGGRMVVVTGFPDQSFQVDGRDLVFRETTLLGSRYASRAEVAEAARMVAAGDIRPVIGKEVVPQRALELHTMLRSGNLLGRGAITWPTHHPADEPPRPGSSSPG